MFPWCPLSPFTLGPWLIAHSTDVNFIASQAVARGQQQGEEATNGEAIDGDATDAMAALERQARAPQGFVAASSGPEGVKNAKEASEAVAANPDAIDLDEDI